MLTLNRLNINRNNTISGVLIYDRTVLCHTLELPWLDNIKDKSCIPTGEYPVVKSNSPRFGEVFYVKNVPQREGILIHAGNTKLDTRGCILAGLDVGPISIARSRDAMERLNNFLPSRLTLTVKDYTKWNS